jgi:hypothetical protein
LQPYLLVFLSREYQNLRLNVLASELLVINIFTTYQRAFVDVFWAIDLLTFRIFVTNSSCRTNLIPRATYE